tara:strand:- start:179 stop:1078 length:900 start_codon:yes stop_codon:yes gene_type:complete
MREAIESALSQTYNNIEIIIVNDGSDDGGKTEKIALSYANNIHYYYKDNEGTSSALNFGIRKMTGDFFCWLSHDDLFLPHKIEKQVSFLLKNKLNVCYSKVYIIDHQGKIIDKDHSEWYPRFEAIKAILGRNYINGCSIMIAVHCFDEVGLFNQNLLYAQDIEMWIRLLAKNEIGMIDDFLVKYRYYEYQESNKKRLIILEESKKMYSSIFDELVIDTLYYNTKKNSDYHVFKAKAYNWFGDLMSSKRYWFDFADQYYKKSSVTWKSLFNSAHIKLILGSKLVSIPSRLKRRVSTALIE